MVKKTLTTLAGAALLMGSSAVAADNGWYAEGQYLSLGVSSDGDIPGYDLQGIGVAFGNNVHENFAVEVIVGTGVGDDDVSYYGRSVEVELDSYYGLVLKPNMDVGDSANIFLNLGYVDLDASVDDESGSTDEFMWGIGAQFAFTEQIYGTASFIDIDQADGFKISVGFNF
jgi:opacity protein-like surface antigen